ncbi:Caulimovirus viroplasmin-domain-containing protein [Syncephalis fuscata]|nr:Caulimovirus viroplasmin-domain-containing protein [Syncephalis fuscata]
MGKNKKTGGRGYYAVKEGREPGIYLIWEEAKQQVEGHSNARYKRFDNIDDAEAFLVHGLYKSTDTTISNTSSNNNKNYDKKNYATYTRDDTQNHRSAYSNTNDGTGICIDYKIGSSAQGYGNQTAFTTFRSCQEDYISIDNATNTSNSRRFNHTNFNQRPTSSRYVAQPRYFNIHDEYDDYNDY